MFIINSNQHSTAVLNLLRLTDHLVNFISVCGPLLKMVLQAHCGWST